MSAWGKGLLAAALTLAGLVVLLVYGLYWYGASVLPAQLPQSRQAYAQGTRDLYWRASGGHGQIAIRRFNPLSYAWNVLRSTQSARPGQQPTDMYVLYQAARTTLFAMPRRNDVTSLRRPFVESALSIRLSRERTPEQLIDLTLEQSWYGRDARGLESAARAYFNVPAAQLSRDEALALFVLLRGPSFYDPVCRRDRFNERYLHLASRVGTTTADNLTRALQRLQPRQCDQPSPALPGSV